MSYTRPRGQLYPMTKHQGQNANIQVTSKVIVSVSWSIYIREIVDPHLIPLWQNNHNDYHKEEKHITSSWHLNKQTSGLYKETAVI